MTAADIQAWFVTRGLPWSDVLAKTIFDIGAGWVEDMKVIPEEMFLSLFSEETFVEKAKAKIAWSELVSESIDLKKTVKVATIELNGKVISPQNNAEHDHNEKNVKGIKMNKKHELKSRFHFPFPCHKDCSAM